MLLQTRISTKGNFITKPSYRERSVRFFQPDSESVMTSPEVTNPRYLAVNAYDKPGLGLELLRYDVLGEARFDSAFCYYITQLGIINIRLPGIFFMPWKTAAART